MTTTYAYEFEVNDFKIYVHFVDRQKSIDAAEALAQIGHFDRRAWAKRTITKMIQSDVQVMQLSILDTTECPFEKRLIDEKWINSAVALMQFSTHQTLCLYRLYSLL